MNLLFGKPVADKILSHLKDEIALTAKKPGLAVILVGNDKASQIYVSLKEKRAHEIGMNFFRYDLAEHTSQAEIIERIEKFNNDNIVNGIIVQLPLPKRFDTEKIMKSIAPEKDADGFHLENTEKFLRGESGIMPVFPRAIIRILESTGENLIAKKAVVIANSQEFGGIMVAALHKKGLEAEYLIATEILSNLRNIEAADVVVSAVGSPGLLRGQMFKSGSIIIDGGIEKVGEHVFGDVDFGSTEALSGWITPVPGGVGPVTIACLLENVFLAFEAQQKE